MASHVELALVWGRDCVLEADVVDRDCVGWQLDRAGWPPHVTPVAYVAKLDAPARYGAGSDLVVSATPTERLPSPVCASGASRRSWPRRSPLRPRFTSPCSRSSGARRL